MSSPALARSDEAGDRLYLWGIPPEGFYSVTTIIGGGVPKWHLPPWYAKLVAELVYAELAARSPHSRARAALRTWAGLGRADVLAKKAAGGLAKLKLADLTERDLATRYLKAEPERVRDRAAALGIEVHDAAEEHVLRLIAETGEAYAAGRELPEWPADLTGHMTSFLAFLEGWRPTYLATEATVFNRAQGYAGTLDAIIQLPVWRIVAAFRAAELPVPGWLARLAPDRVLTILVDYKSGRATYPEVGLQLSAYARGEFIGGADGITEHPVPQIDAAIVLHVTPKGYRPRFVRIDEPIYRMFLHAREVFRFQKTVARTVFLEDLPPPAATPELEAALV
jgi:hypothetical protein